MNAKCIETISTSSKVVQKRKILLMGVLRVFVNKLFLKSFNTAIFMRKYLKKKLSKKLVTFFISFL